MSKDAIMDVPDGYLVRLFGAVQAGDLVWSRIAGAWVEATRRVGLPIDSLPVKMVARKRQEHD